MTNVVSPTTCNKGGSPKAAPPGRPQLPLPRLLDAPEALLRCDSVESLAATAALRRRSSQSDSAKRRDKGFLSRKGEGKKMVGASWLQKRRRGDGRSW